jgi:hypothetical protein
LANAAFGAKVAVFVALSYETLAGTLAPPGPASVKPIVPDCTASLNVAVTALPTATPVALGAGVSDVTAGPAGDALNTTST